MFFWLQSHTQAVRCLRFSPDGKWLASAADDHTVKVIYYDISLTLCGILHLLVGWLVGLFNQALATVTHSPFCLLGNWLGSVALPGQVFIGDHVQWPRASQYESHVMKCPCPTDMLALCS